MEAQKQIMAMFEFQRTPPLALEEVTPAVSAYNGRLRRSLEHKSPTLSPTSQNDLAEWRPLSSSLADLMPPPPPPYCVIHAL